MQINEAKRFISIAQDYMKELFKLKFKADLESIREDETYYYIGMSYLIWQPCYRLGWPINNKEPKREYRFLKISKTTSLLEKLTNEQE